jgi:hypothetical protein
MSTIQVIDQKVWDDWCNNNQDPYGSGVVRFAERWAILMQQKLTEGKAVS